MPRWNNNPADVSAGIPIYDPGDYEIKIKKTSPFVNSDKQGQDGSVVKGSFGVRVIGSIVGGKDDGKPYIINCYEHNEGAQSFSKGVKMAIYGFDLSVPGNEEKFNEFAQKKEWWGDTDNMTVGDGWKDMEGKIVKAALGTKLGGTDGTTVQQTAKYRPV
jgi:hypothetical protein